ncbi:RICIN domain-containing protein [Nonomuraea jabiensis]|uniref:RICIN domain-containing protein n=1 Tax=Nonomuraea jabiensis TaxID=882448 RepID=UPI003D76348A
MSLSRRLLQAAGATVAFSAAGQVSGTSSALAALPWARSDIGVSAYEFDLGQVRPTSGRWVGNQNRTLSHLRFVDVDRLPYVFRANHRLSTDSAAANGGWDAPGFPFRSHVQGHFRTAWAQTYAVLGDTACRDKANHMVAEPAKCQANNGAAGFTSGYLSGFPESGITAVENRTLTNGNVPYYCIHKTLAGLLDAWRLIGNTQAIQNMSTGDGGLALQWADNGTADPDWVPVLDGDALRFRNAHSGKVLGIQNGSTANGAQVVQDSDNGSADNQWRFVPNGARRIQNVGTGMVLGVTDISTADGVLVVLWSGTGTASGSRVTQWADNGADDHRRRLRHRSGAAFRVQCANGGRVLGLGGTSQGSQVVLADDNGSNNNLWRFL